MSRFTEINNEGLELVKKFEGFSRTVYKDAAGYATIGYGHKLLSKENFATITEEQAESILKKDLKLAIIGLNAALSIDLNINQFSAIVSFVFNMGIGTFNSSTLKELINKEDHLGIPMELLKWSHVGKTTMKGLLERRLAEATLYLS